MIESPIIVMATDEIRRQICANLLRPQTSIVIVTPFLNDVDFGNSWSLRALLAMQTRESTTVELFTTAPPLDNKRVFRKKFALLETYASLGVQISVNEDLHAKAFCFNRDGVVFVTVLGSSNMTMGGMREHLELAFFSGREGVYHSVMAHVRVFLRQRKSMSYVEWKAKQRIQIAEALRVAVDDN